MLPLHSLSFPPNPCQQRSKYLLIWASLKLLNVFFYFGDYTLAFIELPVIGIRSADVVVPRKFLSIMSWFVFVLWFSEVWCKIFVLRCNSCLCVQLHCGWCKICSETFLFHLICDFTTTSPNFWDIALKKKESALRLCI